MIAVKKTKPHKEATAELQDCYDRGYSAGYFGANTQNCHFSLFNTPEKTKAWQRGNDAGSLAREKITKKKPKKYVA